MRKWYSNMDVNSGDIVKLVMPEIIPSGMTLRMYEIEYLAIVPKEGRYLSKYTIELVPRNCRSSSRCKYKTLYTSSDSSTLIVISKHGASDNENANQGK